MSDSDEKLFLDSADIDECDESFKEMKKIAIKHPVENYSPDSPRPDPESSEKEEELEVEEEEVEEEEEKEEEKEY